MTRPAPVEPGIPDRLAALLDLDVADRKDLESLLHDRGSSPEVGSAMAILQSRLGTFAAAPARDEVSAAVWTCAIVLFAERTAAWHAERGIDEAISAATLADVGRHLRLHRQTHGVFGLETWWFLTFHLAGTLFQLGRLQFDLRQLSDQEPMPPGQPNWLLDVHIPPTGPLTPEAVDLSLRQAVAFFAEHFPDRPAHTALCFSWLLDPYLVEHLPQGNISGFHRRFSPYGTGVPAQGDALYFVFRTRETADLEGLPRDTSLQRLVLDRIAAGDSWLCCRGSLALGQSAL